MLERNGSECEASDGTSSMKEQGNKNTNYLVWIHDSLVTCMTGVSTIVVIVLTAITLREVVGRFLFNNPTGWANEISGYLVASITFLGAAHSLRSGNMIAVTILTERLRPQLRRWFVATGLLLSFVVVLVAVFYAAKYVIGNIELDRRSNTRLRTPLWIPQSTMVLGLVAVQMELLRQAVTALLAALRREEEQKERQHG